MGKVDMNHFKNLPDDPHRELDQDTIYKIGNKYIWFTDNLIYCADDGTIMDYPFPAYYLMMMQHQKGFKELFDEGERPEPEDINIPVVKKDKSVNPLERFATSRLEKMLERAEKNEDFRKCATIKEELKRREDEDTID